MKTNPITTTLAALCMLAALPASAQSVRPGLWEVTMSGQGNAGNNKAMAEQIARMKEHIANMPAAQRQQIEAAIAAHSSHDIRFTDDGVAMKHCITRDQATDYSKLVMQQGDCTVQRTPAVGGVSRFDLTCTAPPVTGSGTIRFQGETAYTLDMTTTTRIDGQSHTNRVGSTGKWVGANCGSVKPLANGQ